MEVYRLDVDNQLCTELSTKQKQLASIEQQHINIYAELESAKKELKKLQTDYKDLQRSNKRLSSVIAGNGIQILDLSEVFRQQRWARKKQMHTEAM